MPDNIHNKPETIVVDNKTSKTDMQDALSKHRRDKMDAAELAAIHEQRQQAMNLQANIENNEAVNARRKWDENVSRGEKYTAQTLPATIIYNLIELSSLWGKIMKSELDKAFPLPAQLRELFVSKVTEGSFKIRNAMSRKIFGEGKLALPEVSHYVSLDEHGQLKPNPVFPSIGGKALTENQEKLNKVFNEACSHWLIRKGYSFSCTDDKLHVGTFSKDGLLLKQKDFEILAKDPVDGLDAYILESCKVLTKLDDQHKPEDESTPSRGLMPS